MERNHSGKIWNVKGSFGPVFSGYGSKNWYISFAEEGVVAIPTNIFSTLAFSPATVGIITGALAGKEEKEINFILNEESNRVLKDEGNPKWCRFDVHEMEKIIIKRSILGANEIHIKLKGQKESGYGIVDRSQTDKIREVAKRLYLNLYEENGFKK